MPHTIATRAAPAAPDKAAADPPPGVGSVEAKRRSSSLAARSRSDISRAASCHLPQDLLGDDHELHVGRPLVDLSHLLVPEVLLDGILAGEAVSSVHLDHLGGDVL